VPDPVSRTGHAPTLWTLLRTFSWQEVRLHPWRHLVAVLAVMLGVGLALSMHLINASALSEFSAAVQGASGEPDARLRHAADRLDDRWLEVLQAHPAVRVAAPVLEAQTLALDERGERVPVRLLGIDALTMPLIQPALALHPAREGGRLDLFAPDAVFRNPAAEAALGPRRTAVELQTGLERATLRVAGTVAQGGSPLLVMDIAALQDLLQRDGYLSRIDLRLQPGADADALLHDPQAGASHGSWDGALDGRGLLLQRPADSGSRLEQLSFAYRVNLTVLALVALFTGAFLVFSVLSLSVTQRLPAFALLGVLGLDATQRQRLIWAEAAALGATGSVLGVGLGTALAWGALQLLGGDLGGGYFEGVAPALQWKPLAVLGYAALGLGAAVLGGWWPALAVRGIAPAQALKGVLMHSGAPAGARAWTGPLLLGLAVALSFLPAVNGLPLAAYVAIATGLLGGILSLPALVQFVLSLLSPRVQGSALALLALERARRFPGSAAVATSGVVASLALSVALTVMVSSFRHSVTQWLDVMLPADLYVRAAVAAGGAETAVLPPDFVARVASLPETARVSAVRQRSLTLDPARPNVMLLARSLRPEPGAAAPAPVPLPLVSAALPFPASPDEIAIFVSEAMVDVYGARLGQPLELPGLGGPRTRFVVSGIWRDYARQHGSIAIDRQDYLRLSEDASVNDLAVFLQPGVAAATLRQALETGYRGRIEVSASQAIRQLSLRIFDRSFAVTYWLQAVAIGMGLMGVSASFSAQVMARRREFGLLAHVGLSRRQILALVAGEGALWTLLGSVAGTLLGLAVSVVLVHVVNPQSFHWTMDLHLPWARLLALGLSVVLAGTLTAWLSGRLAAGQDAVQAVRQEQ
jgi:putative ABC transport system permease protein